ncbi:MAG: hypothetical protein JNJ54_15145 [Myxococcaceae bacterium]|nr:hypothetical protein [Myxococcaceae bacterium]
MKRAAVTLLLMLATVAAGAVVDVDSVRAGARVSSREGEGRKTQWAPTRNFSALNARAVFASESRSAASPYAGETAASAAGSGIFLSRDSFEGVLLEAPSLHRYTYSHNSPLKYRDPSGRSADSDWSVRRDTGLSRWRTECRAGDSSSCGALESSSWLLDIAATGTTIGMGAAVAAELAGAGELAVGVWRTGGWALRTAASWTRAGAPGVGLGLVAETAADFGSMGLNAFQCAQGDAASCAGVYASAVDVVSGPNVAADVAGVRALAVGTKTRGQSVSGGPEVVGQENPKAPATKLAAPAPKPDEPGPPGAPPPGGGGGGGDGLTWGPWQRPGEPGVPNVVYRGGPRTDKNLTPRPGKDTDPDSMDRGLSTWTTREAAGRPGEKVTPIEVRKLKCIGLVCRSDGHVSLRPEGQAELEDWAATRPSLDPPTSAKPHPLTQEVVDAAGQSEKVSK